MPNAIDITGDRYGKLQVMRQAPNKNGKRRWVCRCDCGQLTEVAQTNLRTGNVKSCGCSHYETITTHGQSTRKEYRAWINMISRCENPNTPGFHRYGGRGIKVCARWRNSFDAFLADMGPRPSPQHSVDRINGDGDYEPANCRWATEKEQKRNICTNRIVEIDGREMTLAEAVERRGLKYNTVLYRILRGKPVAEALR